MEQEQGRRCAHDIPQDPVKEDEASWIVVTQCGRIVPRLVVIIRKVLFTSKINQILF